MLKDDALIQCYLQLHSCLQKLSQLKYIGKNCLTQMANIKIEQNIITNKKQAPLFQQIYNYQSLKEQLNQYCLENTKQKISEYLVDFQDNYLEKYKNINAKIILIERNVIRIYQPKWDLYQSDKFAEKTKQYYMALCQINCLARKLLIQYQEQYKYVQQEWEKVKGKILRNSENQDVIRQIKNLALHISYESHIEGGYIQYWGKILSNLQNKRHKA